MLEKYNIGLVFVITTTYVISMFWIFTKTYVSGMISASRL